MKKIKISMDIVVKTTPYVVETAEKLDDFKEVIKKSTELYMLNFCDEVEVKEINVL